MKLMNWRGIGGILLVLAMLLVNSYWTTPVRAESPAQSISKVSNLLANRIKIKTEIKAQTAAPALSDPAKSDLKTSGELNNTNSEKIYIYFSQQPSTAQINELNSLGITVYPESWIPPVGNHPNGFVLAEMPVDKLDGLAAKSYVMALDTAENEFQYQNDVARSTIGVGDVWTGGDTGAGVTVAVLDSGIDTSNADFPTINSSNSADYGNYPTIDYTVANTVTGHGTHVAGSLLGRGVNSSTYKGVAPGASLVFLKIGDDDGVIASASVIGALHAAVDTYHAKIINMSIGGWDQYHDGSEAECQAVDYATAQGAAVFVAAGNSGGSSWHYSGTVAANTTTGYIPTTVLQGNTSALSNNLVWYVGTGANTNLNLQYFNSSYEQLSPTSTGASLSARGTKSNSYYFSAQQSAGTYYLRVQNTSSTSQFFHIYYNGKSSAVTFSNPDQFYTIESPSAADSAISVGAYESRTSWTNYIGQTFVDASQTLGTISTTSSRGPRVDTGAPLKPDIVAPGRYVISVRDTMIYTFPSINENSDILNYADRIIDNDGLGLGPGNTGPANYFAMSGTSMASPVAAGVGALLLSKNPSLTPAQVKQILENTATDKGPAGIDNIYGYGLVNASAAVNAASPPAAPTLSSPSNSAHVSGTTVTYSWNAVSGATLYAIYVSTTSNFSSGIKYNVSTTNTTLTDAGYPNDGTVYYWMVFAYNGTWSPASSVWSFTNGVSAPPAAPTLSSPSNSAHVSGTTVTYSWNAVSGATLYAIYVSTTSNFSSGIKYNVSTTNTTLTDAGYPNDGTVYYWMVFAYNGTWSPASSVWSFTNGVSAPPAAPTLSSPSNSAHVSGTTVTYSWNAVSGATLYAIYVSTTSNFSSGIKYNVSTTNTTLTDAGYPNDGTVYYWMVFAYNGTWSPASSVWSFTNGVSAPPAAPTLSSPSNSAHVSGTTVTYSWNAVSGATLYAIYVSTTSNFSSGIKYNVSTTNTSLTDTGYPNNGTVYYWMVFAYNGTWGSASSVWSFTNSPATPSAPTLSTPSNGAHVSGTTVTYSWNAVSGATLYAIYVSTTSNFSSGIKYNVSTTNTSLTDTGYPNDGTVYYWMVFAYNGTWGPASSVWSFTNSPATPSAPTLSTPSNGAHVSGMSVTYSWNAVSGATLYAIYVSTTSNFSSGIKYNVSTTNTSLTDTGYPNDGTVYYWMVFAYNGTWGPASSVWSFTNGL